ncbi:unnamed protein product [Prunus brigantina]
MSATKIRTSCFSPNFAAANSPQIPGLKCGSNGTMFISSGILDLDNKDKELEKLLTVNMVGLLRVHKVARINTQVHVILESTTFSMNLKRRRFMVLECLSQVPINGSSGSSYGTSSSCSVSSKTGTLDF